MWVLVLVEGLFWFVPTGETDKGIKQIGQSPSVAIVLLVVEKAG